MPTDQEAFDRRDEGMGRVNEATTQEWKDYADAFIYWYAWHNATVFVDDLWDAGLQPPANRKALGPRLSHAVRQGLLVNTGEYRASNRSNRSAKPVWKSLLHEMNHGNLHV